MTETYDPAPRNDSPPDGIESREFQHPTRAAELAFTTAAGAASVCGAVLGAVWSWASFGGEYAPALGILGSVAGGMWVGLGAEFFARRQLQPARVCRSR